MIDWSTLVCIMQAGGHGREGSMASSPQRHVFAKCLVVTCLLGIVSTAVCGGDFFPENVKLREDADPSAAWGSPNVPGERVERERVQGEISALADAKESFWSILVAKDFSQDQTNLLMRVDSSLPSFPESSPIHVLMQPRSTWTTTTRMSSNASRTSTCRCRA